jgi:hypothetical protein
MPDSGVKKMIVPSPFKPPAVPSPISCTAAPWELRSDEITLDLWLSVPIFQWAGFTGAVVWTPNRTEIVLPGVLPAKFKGFLHEQPPTWRLKGGKEKT